MLVAVQSPEGNKRIECKPTDSITTFLTKVKSAFDLESILTFSIYKDRTRKQLLISSDRKRLNNYDIKHGDTVFLVPNTTTSASNSQKESPLASNSVTSKPVQKNSSSNVNTSSDILSTLKEDEIDAVLMKQSGCIQREKNPNLCHHGPKGKCVHCMSLEPYDEGHLQQHNIKHMSFHSYLRKLTAGVDKGKYAPLENISCKIKSGCKEHLPWPQGICTKCQPNALTLNRQPYRHVDNIAFENPTLVERFLEYWRLTGHQRIGFLYGYYEVHKDVPLGIRATVVAIYEPPQDGSRDHVHLLKDDKAKIVDKIADSLGLRKVGWIFTDLIAEDLQKGTVKHIRNIKSHFLSAQECIMAGHFQNLHPNVCKLSPDGYFGSKFVTICFTGDSNNHAHMEGYQVSNQCMALVRDNCLLPTQDVPELAYVRESSNEQYVPDVFYKEKDGYGNEITQIARPLPVEYLLVDVPVSTPNEPQYTFYFDEKNKPFPIENRLLDGHVQDFPVLVSYLRQFKQDQFLEALSDFHLLIFLATMDVLPLMNQLGPLLTAIKNKDKALATEWLKSDSWATVEQLLDAGDGTSAPRSAPSVNSATASNSDSALWICSYCTFLNQPQVNTCEMCSLPH